MKVSAVRSLSVASIVRTVNTFGSTLMLNCGSGDSVASVLSLVLYSGDTEMCLGESWESG